MLRFFKISAITLVTLIVLAAILVYTSMSLSLPKLDANVSSNSVSKPVELARDAFGQAVINASNRKDAAYALGYAHAQDRLFQMDTQRRAATGKLSELVGKLALRVDKRVRVHQFEKHAQTQFESLPTWQKELLTVYAQGVNDAATASKLLPPEYLLLGQTFSPWQPKDSLLVVFSMYIDLQLGQVDRDLAITRIAHHFGDIMADFIMQPSGIYQAALDGSVIENTAELPELSTELVRSRGHWTELPDIGSNNWAVSGALTDSGDGMLANDMHLGLRVPIIWYRAQLNYSQQGQDVSVMGVTLPGLPGVVVGTNGKIAWGFTNANLDNADWIALSDDAPVNDVASKIEVAKQDAESFTINQSDYGPVKRIGDEQYALAWVAHQAYSANLNLLQLDTIDSVEDALTLAPTLGMPVQNMTVVDADGSIAWTPAGAVTARLKPTNVAGDEASYDANWSVSETVRPVVKDPENNRIWTANARVMSANDMDRYGDGGYAVGARGQQIRDRLFDYNSFDENRFYAIQLDNEARFLMPWHALLINTLKNQPTPFVFSEAVEHLENWQACACPDSVGYTLVRRFRSAVISALFDPIATRLEKEGVSFRPVMRDVEPGAWAILNQRPDSWLPEGFENWEAFFTDTYSKTENNLMDQYSETGEFSDLRWGNVNALRVRHPLGSAIPVFGDMLNMSRVEGFGDSYMPAVQSPGFGASQRLFVRPGQLDKAILTIPGGQSGHPLSPFFKKGFDEYAQQKSTGLLPQQIVHRITIEPLTP